VLQNKTLDELRAKIDQVDDAVHDLLMYRAEVSRAIATAKQGTAEGTLAPAMRPAREAQILRRLLARHKGPMPARVVVRIWREIIAASLQSQAKFQLHVYAGENQRAFIDLAQAYFGSQTPVRGHNRASQVVHACAEDPDSLGVVPLPPAGDATAWWSQLAPAGQPGPRVIAKLPFVTDGEESPLAAFALGAVEQEPTGDDTTLLRLETGPHLRKPALNALLKNSGLEAQTLASGKTADKSALGVMLLEVSGFVGPSDPRLQQLRQTEGDAVRRIDPVGGYANPVVVDLVDGGADTAQ
jgi:chorismate mutase/prephenate dehydratase